MNYEDLTKRIEKAKKASTQGEEMWWNGYLAALYDVRNEINVGG